MLQEDFGSATLSIPSLSFILSSLSLSLILLSVAMAEVLSKSGLFVSMGINQKRRDFYLRKGLVSVKSGGFGGKRLVLDDHRRGRSRKGSSAPHAAKMSTLSIGKSMKWWNKGLQLNMKEIISAQDLVDSLSDAGDKLVIVDFFSPGCGGCKALHPKICQFAVKNGDVVFLHVNYEEHKSMCYDLNVHVLPFFRFYRGAQGRLCSFSCTNATIKKFKDALAKHTTERCSLGPAKGLEESELLALAANKDLSFSYTRKPVVPQSNPDEMVEPTPAGPKLPVPRTTRVSTQVSLNSLVTPWR